LEAIQKIVHSQSSKDVKGSKDHRSTDGGKIDFDTEGGRLRAASSRLPKQLKIAELEDRFGLCEGGEVTDPFILRLAETISADAVGCLVSALRETEDPSIDLAIAEVEEISLVPDGAFYVNCKFMDQVDVKSVADTLSIKKHDGDLPCDVSAPIHGTLYVVKGSKKGLRAAAVLYALLSRKIDVSPAAALVARFYGVSPIEEPSLLLQLAEFVPAPLPKVSEPSEAKYLDPVPAETPSTDKTLPIAPEAEETDPAPAPETPSTDKTLPIAPEAKETDPAPAPETPSTDKTLPIAPEAKETDPAPAPETPSTDKTLPIAPEAKETHANPAE